MLFFYVQLNTTRSLPWVWSLDARLFRNKSDTVLNCEENSILGNGLPQRADLEHQCLTLKLLSIKVHPCSIFCTIWANNNHDGKVKRQASSKPVKCKQHAFIEWSLCRKYLIIYKIFIDFLTFTKVTWDLVPFYC